MRSEALRIILSRTQIGSFSANDNLYVTKSTRAGQRTVAQNVRSSMYATHQIFCTVCTYMTEFFDC